MRVFGIQPDATFREYLQTPFEAHHEEAILERWLESNPEGIVEEGRILMIGRQVSTNLGGFIDLLGIDRDGAVVVVELKRDRTPRDTLAQALEYASFAERLDTEQLEGILRSYLNDESLNLAEHHREYFELHPDEAVAFNKDQHIVLVGQRVTPEIKQTASYLRSKGIPVTCVEFSFFRADGGTCVLAQEIVVGRQSQKPGRVLSGSLPIITREAFLRSLDPDGRAVFARILEFARTKSMPIHWGTKGFSLNVDLDGTHVGVCYGYPPGSVYKQSIYTAFVGPGGITSKIAASEEVVTALRKHAEATGLFKPAGREMKCLIDRQFSDAEVSSLLGWCQAVAEAITTHGLNE